MNYRLKHLTSFVLICFFSVIIAFGKDQVNDETESLIVSPSKFSLIASRIKFNGEKTFPNPKAKQLPPGTDGLFIMGETAYFGPYEQLYESSYEGLIEQNLRNDTARMYSMQELANSAGWFVADREKGDLPNGIYGLHRSGDELWMGTSGIGFMVFNTKTKLWSRYDKKTTAIPGDHASVNYADKDYVFLTAGEFPGAFLLVYSKKFNKFLRLERVATKLFSEFGHTTEMAQVPVNHTVFASQPYVKIDWTFMLPQVVSGDNGNSYIFAINFSESKTVFTINREQLKNAFSKLYKN